MHKVIVSGQHVKALPTRFPNECSLSYKEQRCVSHGHRKTDTAFFLWIIYPSQNYLLRCFLDLKVILEVKNGDDGSETHV